MGRISVDRRFSHHAPIVFIVALHVALGIAYGVANPIFESPDELSHFAFVRHLAAGRGLPIQSEEAGRSENHQPPLYYLASAVATFWINTDDFPAYQRRNPFWGEDIMSVKGDNKNQFLHGVRESAPYQGTVLAVHVLRLVSTALGAITVLFTYLIASQVFPSNRAIALGSTVFVAFNPQFVFVNSSVTNDSLVATLSAATVFALIKMSDVEQAGVRQGLALGSLVGAAILAKLTAIMLIPLVGIAVVLWAVAGASGPRVLKFGLASLLAAVGVSGWWFVRNLALYQEWSGMETMQRIWGTHRSNPLDAGRILDAMPTVWRSYWGAFGWGNVPLDECLYQAVLVLVGAAAAGLVLGIARWSRCKGFRGGKGLAFLHSGREQHLVLLASWLMLNLAGLIFYIQTAAFSEFGRFLFPSISSIGLFIFVGLSQLVPSRYSRVVAAISGAAMMALSLTALVVYLIPAYSRPPALNEKEVVAQRSSTAINFGNRAEILAYELRSKRVEPGQAVEIDVYWRALAKMNDDYVVFIHLLTVGDNRLVAQRDTHPGGGTFPTSSWIPGEVFRDTYRVRIPSSFEGPGILRVDVGMYLIETMERLPLVSGDRGLGKDASSLGVLRIPPSATTTYDSIGAVLGEGVVLAGYELASSDAVFQKGQPLAITLFWRAERDLKSDHTVFVHLVDEHGRLLAQHDGKPANGNYPTFEWEADDLVPDKHVVQLPRDMLPGDYRVLVGMYDPVSMERLAVLSANKPVVDSAVTLCRVSVE